MHYETKICKRCGTRFSTVTESDYCRKCKVQLSYKVEHACLHCGKSFTGLPETIYCRGCRSHWKTTPHDQTCDCCNLVFKAFYDETTCPACRKANLLQTKHDNKICKFCGKSFKAVHRNERYCPDCKDKVNCRTCICVVCGKEFVPKRTNETCKTCSRTCQGYYIQQQGYGMKYNDKELLKKLTSIIAKEGVPTSMEELLRKAGNITFKVVSARHWTLNYLLNAAGYNIDPMAPRGSKFEVCVWEILADLFGKENIQTQYRFSDCRNKVALPFDFYIEKYNLCVEADGVQHYTDCEYLHSSHIKQTDAIKNAYCLEHGIGLIRIKYSRKESTKEQIKKAIQELLPTNGEIRPMKCFNCWDGSKWIPISSQAQTKHKARQTVVITRRDEKTVQYEVTREGTKPLKVILDAEFVDTKMGNSTVYIKNGKVLWSKTGTLLANAVLEHKGHGKWITKYRNGDVFDLRKENLYLIENKEQARPKRGAYKTSKTGIPGVNLCKAFVKGKYYYTAIATHRITGKKKNFPVIRYGSPEAALEAAKAWAWEGSTTIPEGSTPKPVEMGTSQTDKAVGEDIV